MGEAVAVRDGGGGGARDEAGGEDVHGRKLS